MADCYVYYRVADEHEQAARHALHAMQAELQTCTGIVGRAYSKATEPRLWMEVYNGIADPDALVDLLDRLAERHWLIGCLAENQRRHVEHFLPLAAP